MTLNLACPQPPDQGVQIYSPEHIFFGFENFLIAVGVVAD